MSHSTRSLRWLTPAIRRERNEWKALCALADFDGPIASEAAALRTLKEQFQDLQRENRELKIPEAHLSLSRLQARAAVILERCRLYLASEPARSLSHAQLPHLERILDFVRTEQVYIKRQLLLSQTTIHYLKQLLSATEGLWTEPFCNPNYLLNLIRKIKHDDARVEDPGELLFISLTEVEAEARKQIPSEDLLFYIRGLETARCSYFVSRQIPAWKESGDLLMLAGLVHELGWLLLKTKSPEKPDRKGKQRGDEWLEHPTLGAALLGGLRGFPGDSYLSEVVAQHHERLDGTGYPRRLHTYHLSDHSRRMAVICRYLELKNDSKELTADGLRSCDGEEFAFGAALELYREALRGEWDEPASNQLFQALDENLLEELRASDEHNDPFSLKNFQSYRADELHTGVAAPHFSLDTDSRLNSRAAENQAGT